MPEASAAERRVLVDAVRELPERISVPLLDELAAGAQVIAMRPGSAQGALRQLRFRTEGVERPGSALVITEQLEEMARTDAPGRVRYVAVSGRVHSAQLVVQDDVALAAWLYPTDHPMTPARRPGVWAGRIVVSEDFDETTPELVAAFDGAVEPPEA